jgi:light-regulated signal transduction histidine kinase (bacteriophytochrome)
MFAADGFAAVQGTDIYIAGKCASASDVREVAAWVETRTQLQPYNTDRLGEAYSPARSFQQLASGLLAVTLKAEEPINLLWFRAEQLQIVNWAGNPHKEVQREGEGTLTPRASFAAWSETVSGNSLPWTPPEIDAANRMSHAILQVWQHRRLRSLNQELIATIAENQTLLVQKDFLIKEVHHRVQNSLALVSAFLGIQAQAAGKEALAVELGEAQRRLSAVGLVHRRLYSGTTLQTVDLARYLEDLCTDTMSSMGEQWGGLASFELASVVVPTDRAVHVGLILTELLINVQKYAYAGVAGPITVNLSQQDGTFSLIVLDRGTGITQTREGFGTRMLNAMVKKLAGNIDYEDNEPGLRVRVTAPIGEPVD